MYTQSSNISFTRDHDFPGFRCPTCKNAELAFKPSAFMFSERAASIANKDDPDWDPDWTEYSYSCLLQCTNPCCRDIIASTGYGKVDYFKTEDRYGHPTYEPTDVFYPLFFYPTLKLLNIPTSTHVPVKEALEKSFALYYSNPTAAANQVRIALEELLTALKIPKKKRTAKGLTALSLHARIQCLPPKLQDLVQLLLAVKWIGNAGSHSGKQLTHKDLQNAYEVVEHALSEIFEGKKQKLLSFAKKVNKAKGP